ncbi:MAG: hypothetical protein Q8N15_06920 [Bacillota bacterium]|nr:hypothetical protein [Bacillota bacterium]
MSQWWETLTVFQQSMFVVASIATIIMTIFLILMLFGIEGGEASAYAGDVDVDDVDLDGEPDVDGINDEPLSSFSGLKIVTVRGVLAFLAIGGWTAFSLGDVIQPWLASLLGVVAGGIAAFLLAYAIRAAYKLENEGNLDYQNAVGMTGTVYIRVPKARSGSGKVSVLVQERLSEADAVTDDLVDLLPGEAIEVLSVDGETTLVVKRK